MKILLAGYYGFGNLGDEWSLASTIEMIKAPGRSLTVLSHCPRATAVSHQIDALSRWNPFVVMKALWQHDLLILAGGSLLQDRSSRRSPTYYLGLIALAKLMNKPVVMMSQGIGPIEQPVNQVLCGIILPWVDLVIARDHASWLMFQDFGVTGSRCREAADLVWLQPVKKKQTGKNQWLVIVRADWLQQVPPLWLHPLLELAAQQNKQVAWLAIGGPEDGKILQAIKATPVGQHSYFYQPNEWQTAFERAQLVISMRYHGLLMGARHDAVLVGIGDDPKIEQLLTSLSQVKAQPHDLINLIRSVNQTLPDYQQHIQFKQANLISAARAGCLALQSFLVNRET